MEQKKRRSIKEYARCRKDKEYADIIENERNLVEECDKYEDISDYGNKPGEIVAELDEIQQEMRSYDDMSVYREVSCPQKSAFNVENERELVEEYDEYEDISDYGNKLGEIIAEADEIQQTMGSYEDISDYGKERKPFETLNEIDTVPYELAQIVLRKYKFRYLDPPDIGKLHRFNGKIWEPMAALEEIELLVYEQMGEEERKAQKSIKCFCRKVVEFIQYECMERYKSGERFSDEDFKEIENRIVFQNCVYDVLTEEILHHDCNLPYYFEIDADYIEGSQPTPMYNKLRIDATKNDWESMKMFDWMLGYLMIPNRSGKCYFVMSFARDSGKSMFGHFIESIYKGHRVKTIDLERLAEKFSLSNADSMVLLSGLETGTNRLNESVVAQIKRITGEDKMWIETKYKNEVNAKIRFKLLLATNGGMLLEKNIKDKAFYRRTIVIPFKKSIPMGELIADMPERLQEEKSAILSNAARHMKEIINTDGGIVFRESEYSKTMKQTWAGEFIFEDLFIKCKLIYSCNPEDALPKEDIYKQYQIFLNKHLLIVR